MSLRICYGLIVKVNVQEQNSLLTISTIAKLDISQVVERTMLLCIFVLSFKWAQKCNKKGPKTVIWGKGCKKRMQLSRHRESIQCAHDSQFQLEHHQKSPRSTTLRHPFSSTINSVFFDLFWVCTKVPSDKKDRCRHTSTKCQGYVSKRLHSQKWIKIGKLQ